MKKLLLAVLLSLPLCLEARDAARDLRRLVGYTIVASDSVSEVLESKNLGGGKILKLSDGTMWRVDGMLLDPLVLTDVIILAKGPAGAADFKLLVDNEVFDAELVTSARKRTGSLGFAATASDWEAVAKDFEREGKTQLAELARQKAREARANQKR